MTTALKDLMDDVAADVVTGRLIDVAAVREGASHRRDRLRALGTALMLTAAAVLAALVALPIFATLSVAPASGGRTGLPDRWYYAPVSAPTVKTWHMPAASMVLRGPDRTQWTLVSADTTRYARLPGRDVQQVALSDDGRKVAWVASDGGRLTLTELILADGKTRSQQVALTKGLVLLAVAYDGDSVRLAGESSTSGADFERTATFDGDRLTVTNTGVGIREAAGEVVDPGGTRSARVQGVDGRFYVGTELVGSNGLRRPGWALPKEVTGVQLLAWAPGGVVMRLDYTESDFGNRRSSVALMNPDTGELRAISRPGEGTSTPVVVAPDVVGAGESIKAVPPSFPRWNSDRIRYVLGNYWGNLYSSHHWTILSVGVVLAGLLLLVGRRLRRRHPKPEGLAFRARVAHGPTVRRVALRSTFALAAAVLVAVAVPAAYFGDQFLGPAGTHSTARGLPDRWYATSLALPTMRTWPMVDASMVLANHDMTRYVMVSGDGTRYARIPGKLVLHATLSLDGRRVAWVSGDDDRAVLHDLRLLDGTERTQVLRPQGLLLQSIRYVGDDVHLGFGADGAWSERVATFDDRGTLRPAGEFGPAVNAAKGLVLSPDGSSAVRASGNQVRLEPATRGWRPDAGVQRSFPLPAQPRTASALSWTKAGVLLRLEAQGGASRDLFTLALLDPESGDLTTVSRTDTAWSPVSVASGLVGSGGTVRAASPYYPRWHADTALWVWRQHRIALVSAVTALFGAGLAIGFVVRRRRPTEPTEVDPAT